MSPTKTIEELTGIASTSLAVISISIMEASSTMIMSPEIGLFLSCSKLRYPSSCFVYFNNLWIVDAGIPVLSSSLFAALPVGAQRTTLFSIAFAISTTDFMIVVFPVPGPPVITVTLFLKTSSTADFCLTSSSSLWST